MKGFHSTGCQAEPCRLHETLTYWMLAALFFISSSILIKLFVKY